MTDLARPGSMAAAAPAATPRTPAGAPPARPDADVATAFEAAFLTGMLKQSGLTRSLGALAGNGGESGFSDLLTREIAADIARSRPLGIGAILMRKLAGEG